METTIMQATLLDYSAVSALEKKVFPQDAWTFFDIITVLTSSTVIRRKVLVDGCFAGFAAIELIEAEQKACLMTIGILPEYQSMGLGELLLKSCESEVSLPSIELCVAEENSAAIHLYLKNAYHQIGVWPAYYDNERDALVMEKRLRNEGCENLADNPAEKHEENERA